jgi:type VI secretion system protein ImpL
MRGLLTSVIARWVLSFIGTALLAALLWFFGPFLSFLEGWGVRLAIIIVMFLLWLGINLLIDWLRRRREKALAEGIAASDPVATARFEEAAGLEDKLAEAMRLLRKSRGNKGYLYEQPWYMIIGPPGAGKTTMLANSGLRFPLAAEMGLEVLGSGGTRQCEWYFTEDAVLIDTAGRYTTQDSDAAVDKAGWDAFLALLKRTRIRQPLNGIIVAISLTEIAGAPQAERLAHARAIRRRIKELQEQLAIRLPVYALFTKADLIAGFTEFFDDLDRDKRGQVWGATFPLTDREAGPVPGFRAEFQPLIERLDGRLFDRLQAERSPDRRTMIAGFAPQVASLEDPLAEFLQEAFGGSRLDPAPMLRGFYLSSGTQEGTPIDRLTAVLARSFGIDQRRAASLRPEQGRSYFLPRLLKEVIFGEAMLASERPGAARRRFIIRTAAFSSIALVTLLLAGLLWHIRSVNEGQINEMTAALDAYEKTYRDLKAAGKLPDPISDPGFGDILPLLDQARALPHGYGSTTQAAAWYQLGLSPHDNLSTGAKDIYGRTLQFVLFPRLMLRLESKMAGIGSSTEELLNVTKVYLVLGKKSGGGAPPLDAVKTWFQNEWKTEFAGSADQQERLAKHLNALLEDTLPQFELNDELLARARAELMPVTKDQSAYSRIKSSAAAKNIPAWTPAVAAGPAGNGVFIRGSGAPLTDGIPGFYTVTGFHKVLLPALDKIIDEINQDSWVIGRDETIRAGTPEAQKLVSDIIKLYENDYRDQWNKLLGDLSIVSLADPRAPADSNLRVLAAPGQSPMQKLLACVARQLTLSQAPPDQAVSAPCPPAAAQPPPAAGPVPDPPGIEIDRQYAALRDYVSGGPDAPIEQTLKVIAALRTALTQSGNTGGEAIQALEAQKRFAPPEPVQRWLEAMAKQAKGLFDRNAAAALRTAYLEGAGPGPGGAGAGAGAGATVGPGKLCQDAVLGHYPFVKGAQKETAMIDFIKLFSPGGLFDTFFNTQLKAFVDTSGNIWRPRSVENVPAPIALQELQFFQQAGKIRDAFFATGGTTPAISFDLTPQLVDSGTTQVTLDLSGAQIVNKHDPPHLVPVNWPGSNGMKDIRLVFEVPPASGSVPPAGGGVPPAGGGVLEDKGDWALFRFLDRGQPSPAGDKFQITFRLGEHSATFEIRSSKNPFSVLRGFQCPTLR